MVEPKKAAACIIVDAEGRILMAKRSPKLRFMPGHHAFPGGRIDADETTEFVVGADDEDHARAVTATAREVFEETGLFLAQGKTVAADVKRRAREDLLEGRTSYADILREFDAHITADLFEPAGIWVTPPISPVRFDTRYYLFRHSGDEEAELIEGELVGLDWLHPTEARRRWHVGEILVSTPIACTLHPIAARAYPDYMPILQRSTNRRPGHPGRFEIRHGIHVVPLATQTIPPASQTNCFFVGEEELLIVDPGSDDPDELDHLRMQIDHMKKLGSQLHAIVLTHSHPDHVAGVTWMREHYGIPVWAHAVTAERVDFSVDRLLEDEEIVTLPGDPGWRVRVLHTPGHDPGHIALLEETTGTLLCGDMIANPGTIVVSEEYGGNMNEFLDSLDRLIALEEARLIIPSHGMPEGSPQEVLRKHRDHRLWRENKIREAYEGGATTLKDLLSTAYDDAPKEALPLAEHSLRAHLARLGFSLDG